VTIERPSRVGVILLWLILLLAFLSAQPSEPLVVAVTVTEDAIQDRRMRFFTLTRGKQGAITVMGDRDLEVIQWLGAHVGQRVPITLGHGK
jgi:uncharacterized membrane protein (DUF2068 family)